jgi:hypothetical protein
LADGKFPDWFLQDLRIASRVSFPIEAAGYGLDLDEPGYEKPPSGVTAGYQLGVMGQVWVGENAGSVGESSYSSYAGPIDMKSICERAESGPQGLSGASLSWIYVLEDHNGEGMFEAAVLCSLDNARYLAFAPGQVIIGSDHAARDEYDIYPVSGISISNPPITQDDIQVPSQIICPLSDSSIPDWYTQDLQTASKVTSPVKPAFYTLNWGCQITNEEPPGGGYSEGTLGVLGQVWIGERAGNAYRSFYSYDYADGVENGSPEFAEGGAELSWIYVLEDGTFEAAVLCPLGNAEFLAFAPDQVIIGSNHSGFDDYAIYPVQGIIIPNAPDRG